MQVTFHLLDTRDGKSELDTRDGELVEYIIGETAVINFDGEEYEYTWLPDARLWWEVNGEACGHIYTKAESYNEWAQIYFHKEIN